jgi:hypothetical protein
MSVGGRWVRCEKSCGAALAPRGRRVSEQRLLRRTVPDAEVEQARADGGRDHTAIDVPQ